MEPELGQISEFNPPWTTTWILGHLRKIYVDSIDMMFMWKSTNSHLDIFSHFDSYISELQLAPKWSNGQLPCFRLKKKLLHA